MTGARGRPKRSDIQILMVQGKNSQSPIKCNICNRTFPRMKSLRTHLATHSNVKNYICDFPDCEKAFKQSSQLQNHLLLHSKEKPFICPVEDCFVRYTHSCRICPSHKDLRLIKQLESADEIRQRFYRNVENVSEQDIKWLNVYLDKRERKLQSASKKRKIAHESSQEIHEECVMNVSGSDEEIFEDTVVKVGDSDEDIIMQVSGSDEDSHQHSTVSGSDEEIFKDTVVKVGDSDEDIIMQVGDSDEDSHQHSTVSGSDEEIFEDTVVKVGDSDEDSHQHYIDEEISETAIIKKISKYYGIEETCEDENLKKKFQHGVLFCSFLKSVGNKFF